MKPSEASDLDILVDPALKTTLMDSCDQQNLQPAYEPDYGDLNDEEIKLVNEYVKQWESEQYVIDMQRKGRSAYCREVLYWDAMIMVRMKRMAENEEYRLKIAKMLS